MEQIAKKYRVLKKLGQGAMGEVYLVLPPHGEPVALKLLKSLEAEANKQALEQFENEFKVLKRLAHPNIGRIFDYGFDEQLNKVFFTLPWLQGQEIFEATKDITYETCEEYFVQTLRALNYLHQKKLIHCDLKPGNIYIENNKVILIDFGLTGYWGENIVGTPTYLAPEIFHGKHHTVASDLYAVGVIFYNCLTRSQPFSGKDLQEVYDRHRCFTPPPATEVNPKVPKYMSDIIATLINKKPEERYPSAASVIEEIDAYSQTHYSVETEDTLLSYLPTESEVPGNEENIMDIMAALEAFNAQHIDEPYHLILVQGKKNVGKGRLLTKIKNELQLAKVSVEQIKSPLSEQQKEVLSNSTAVIIDHLDTFFLTTNELLHLKQVTDLIEQRILATTTSRFMVIASACDATKLEAITKLFPTEETRATHINIKPYTLEETDRFLTHIIGQKEIPKKFVEQFYLNTEGLPGIALDLIQSMIANGLLFDKSGRWNEDLLVNLESTFDSIQVSETLEQEFEKTYNSLTGTEEDIVNWLSLCPHPLTGANLISLIGQTGVDSALQTLLHKNIVRNENGQITLARSVFQNFIQNNLPNVDAQRRHTLLAHPKTKLDKFWALYHLSLGNNPDLKMKAGSKLAETYKNRGERDKAVQCYLNLIKDNATLPLSAKIDWYIEAASLLIWLDRFVQTVEIISGLEQEIQKHKTPVQFEKFLILLEKKGQALLHQLQLEKAKTYFDTGLKHAVKSDKYKVQELRFQNDLGLIETILGHKNEAIAIFKKTRDAAKQLPPEKQPNITNNDLGHVYLSLKQSEDATKYLTEDIELFTPLTNKEPLARALYSFAELLAGQKNFDGAIAASEKCAKLCRDSNNHPLLLRVYNGLGNTYLLLEDFEQAIKNYQKAIEIAVRLNELTSKAALLYNQGVIYRKDKNSALALRRFLMAKQVLENKKGELLAYDESLLSRCYADLAQLSIDEQNSLKALSYQLERIKLVTSSENLKPELFSAKYDLAKIYMENRLNDQFTTEIEELRKIAASDEDKEAVTKLSKQWETIQNHTTQEITGKIVLK
ncbi:MAG: multi-sensor signal transduction multi-kinase [uncultured bacterium]|nr:MAG: multi-sensor signal transduction multi-kinase [uncultured bacterium]